MSKYRFAYSIGLKLGALAFSIALATLSLTALAEPMAAPPDPPASAQARPLSRLSKWPVDDANPESSIPTPAQRDGDPLQFGYFLMDVSDRAEAAQARGDHLAAIKYFRTLAKAVPNRSISFSKLCSSYRAIGDWQSAVATCKEALFLQGVTVDDVMQYAQVMFEMKPGFNARDAQDVDAVVQHVRQQMPDATLADELECQLGLKVNDLRRLQHCTDELAKRAPDSPKTLTFQWAYALERKDFSAARGIIARAKQIKEMPLSAIQRMETSTSKADSGFLGLLGNRWLLRAVLSLILLGGAAAMMIRRRRQVATVG